MLQLGCRFSFAFKGGFKRRKDLSGVVFVFFPSLDLSQHFKGSICSLAAGCGCSQGPLSRHTAVLWGRTCCTHCPVAVRWCSARCLWLPTAQPSSELGCWEGEEGHCSVKEALNPLDVMMQSLSQYRRLFVTSPHRRALCIPNLVLWSFQTILSKIIGLHYGDRSPRHVHTQVPSVPAYLGRIASCARAAFPIPRAALPPPCLHFRSSF